MKAFVCSVFLGILIGATPACAEWIADAEVSYGFDDNVSRGRLASDIRSDSALLVRATGGYYVQWTDRTGMTLSAGAQREQHLHYHGLSYNGVGPAVSLRTKLGVGPLAPWMRWSAAVVRREFDDDTRTGWLMSTAGALGARLSEQLDVHTELTLERRTADRKRALVPGISGAAFDLDSVTASVGGSSALNRDTLLSAVYSHRRGDVVSSTRRNPVIFAASAAITLDPVFAPDTIAYKLNARSHIFDVQLNHALSERMSVNVGVARSLTYGDGGNDYYSSSATASLLYTF